MARRSMGRRTFLAQAAGSAVSVNVISSRVAAGEDTLQLSSIRNLADWSTLDAAVQSVLKSKRIGRPVFARVVLTGVESVNTIVPQLAIAIRQIENWMGQPVESLFAVGTLQSGQVSINIQFSDGASALVSGSIGKIVGDGVDLMLIGNRGVLHYEGDGACPFAESSLAEKKTAERRLTESINAALLTGQPKLVRGQKQP